MRTAADIIAARYGIDKKYLFTIEATGFSQVLNYAPDNFYNGKMRLVRNKTYRGMVRYISFGVLVFYKDGKDILSNFYEAYGTEYDVFLKVEVYEGGVPTLYVNLKLDFSTYKNGDISVRIQAVDTSFTELIKNREDIKVNLFSTTSIDGVALTDFPNGLNLIDTSINKTADWSLGTGTPDPIHIIPITLGTSTFSEAQNSGTVINSNAGAFFYNCINPSPLVLDIGINGTMGFVGDPPYLVDTYTAYLYVYDSNNNRTQSFLIGEVTGDSATANTAIALSKIISLTVNPGDSLILQATWGALTNEQLTYNTVPISLSESLIGLPVKTIRAFAVYDAFLRVVQQLTGVDDCLRSDTFGRTDTPIHTYSADGIILHLLKGRFLRDNSEMPFPVSLKDLFESINSIYNIGLAVESGNVVRIEKIDYFFQNTITLDISDIVTPEITTIEVSPEDIYKQIQVGFDKFGNQKDVTNDVSNIEFNTKATYTTEIKSVTTGLNIISKVRGDSTDIIKLANDTDLAKNASGDNDLFFLKSVRDTSGFKVETDEQFSSIIGAPYGTKTLNLDLSPARSLLRWGDIIHAGLKIGTIRWQNTDNNYKLSTQKTTETVPVTERADIDYSVLAPPIFKAEKIKVTVALTFTQINTIFENPNGLIKISADKQGWIDEMIVNNKDNMVELTLIRQ